MEMGFLFDKLENKDEISKWIKVYAGFRDCVNNSEPEVSLDWLLRFWDSNKEQLYHLLGDKIIYEKQIKYEKSYDELSSAMHDMVNSRPGRYFYKAYTRWVDTLEWEDSHRLYPLIWTEYLVSNRYSGRSFKININGKEISVQTGSKTIKILGKIAEAVGLNSFEEFRVAHSMILNNRMTKGTLCLSIHPLDYFTMSDNEYDWESCMSWREQGCYRMGTVEMCNSSMVVVAYLKGEKEMRFYNSSWNSKKWRNLFIVHPDIITGIKGYPYQSSFLDTECIKALRALASRNLGWEYETTIHEHEFTSNCEDICIVDDDACVTGEYYLNFDTEFMYNDFGNSNITHFVLAPRVDHVSLNYSGPAVCMCCGDTIICYDSEEADKLFCDKCLNYAYCEDCGDRVYNGEWYELDDRILCESCYCDHRVCDAVTGDYHYDGNCNFIYIVDDPDEDIKSQSYGTFTNNHKAIWVYEDNPEFNNFDFAYLTETTRYGYTWTNEVKYIRTSNCTSTELEIIKESAAYM